MSQTRLSMRVGASALALILSATAAYAQEGAPDSAPPEADATEEGDAIVVTGSRIRRPNLDSAVPVTSVTGEEFFETGTTSVGDVLNELPSLRNTFSQSNSSRFLGTAGLNLLDLRGLGTNRTLVLQNGRRHIGSNILGNGVEVDVNTIPTDLIERVDVVTGGNSAIYGSDAIAGVVNFILKQDYEGLQIRGQGGVSQHGDAGQYYVSALAGTNFGDGRGNITVNLEYARQQDWYASQRNRLSIQRRFEEVDIDEGEASDGIPDNRYFEDVRFPFYNNGGEFVTCCISGPNSDLNFQSYLFQPDGTLVAQTGEVFGTDYFNTRLIGGNGSTAREGKAFGLAPKLDRYSANILAHYEISPALVPFIEAKYTRTDSLGNASGPFFFGLGAIGSPREVFYTENPFLNPQARQFISDYYGVGTDENVPFGFSRTATDLGNREEAATRETYRIVAGVRGDFNEDWSYELSANYGELKEDTTILGNVNVQRFLLSIDAVRDAGGNIVCRSTIDPSARLPFEFATDSAFAQAQLANDVAQCVPGNFFGEGNLSQAARDYILQDTVAKGRLKQFVASAFLSGDSSQFLELPGGPIGFALGAEYRRESIVYQQDETVQAGLTFYNAIPTFDPPSFEVKEVFGEIRVPILKDTDFFQELTLSAAGRVADYKGGAGTVFAYNVGGQWAPIRDLRFRANFSRAVRAPSLADLYTPLGQNFALPFTDPCSTANLNAGSENRAANCAADGRPADFNYVYNASLQFLSGGNTDLQAETSDSWTFGAVLQPSFAPGFSLSVDYYNITVNDVITSPTAQQLVNACYDLPDLDNQFCSLFDRAGAGGGPRGEQPFRILEGSLQASLLNYAALKVRGIDVEAAYRKQIDGLGQLNARLVYTRVLQNDQFLDPTDPQFADQILYELGDPRDAFNFDASLKTGPVTVGYQLRYIGKQVTNVYEDFFSKQGRDPQNPDWSDIRFYPSVIYHDLRVAYDVNDKFNFYVGVDNVTNRLAPLDLTTAGAGSGIFSNIGRYFYAGAVAKF